MVAEFLKLKLRLLGNSFSRPGREVAAILGGTVVAIALVVLFVIFFKEHDADNPETSAFFVIAGSLVSLIFFLGPLVTGIKDRMSPQSFALYGIPTGKLAALLALAGLLSLPLVFVLIGGITNSLVVWNTSAGVAALAIVATLLGIATVMLLSKIAALLAALFLTTKRARETAGLLALLLLIVLSPAIVIVLSNYIGRPIERFIVDFGNTLAFTPFGAAWALPGDAATGAHPGLAIGHVLIALVSIGALWFAWRGLISHVQHSVERSADRHSSTLGWFGRTLPSRSGAVAARALTYWARDPRYPVPLLGVVIFLGLTLVAFVTVSVPLEYFVMIIVPAISLTLAFSVHNDVALDNTAIWLHVVSGKVGLADRVGRIVPVLLFGIPLIAIGSVLSVYFTRDWEALPGLLGVSTVLLFGGLGAGNLLSAGFPYPAVRPGDGPFDQPQLTGAQSFLVQAGVVAITFALATPSAIFAVRGYLGEPELFTQALWWGVGAGLFALIVGTWAGGRVFDRRGPEILASAIRN